MILVNFKIDILTNLTIYLSNLMFIQIAMDSLKSVHLMRLLIKGAQ